uniref:Fibroblast growth factor 2 n=1 Tax=Erinnyis ello granulovirus TaxID=307444 RepID=A0A288WJJ0_9BBAC|nr:fibroblast growth factor 2 [Erinnyis ello granulovirus]
MNCRNLLLNFVIFVCAHTTAAAVDPYKYIVDDGIDLNLLDGEHIYHDAHPMRYLANTNKTSGLGYTIGVRRDKVNLYVQRGSVEVRSIPSNYTFYFYKDNDNKYYIRNNVCRFLCIDMCGVAFVSPVRYKHHCKFYLNATRDGSFSILYVNNGKRRDFMFDSVNNILRVNKTVTDEHPFVLKHGPVQDERRCRPIAKSVQQTMVVNEHQCTPKTTNASLYLRGGVKVAVRKDDHRYYKMQLYDGTRLFENDMFVTHTTTSPGLYAIQNVNTCEFLCYNDECGVYTATTNNFECKVRMVINRDKTFYVRFYQNDHNLLYNTTTNELSCAMNKKSRVKFVLTNDDVHRYSCNNLNIDSRQESTKKCKKNNVKNKANSFVLSLPNLVFFLMLSYNNTNVNK